MRLADGMTHIHQHAAPLHTGLCHFFYAQCVGMRGHALAGLGKMGVGAITIVEHMLGNAVAIGIEGGAIVAEPVPLGGILQGQQHPVVVDDISASAAD